MIMKQNCWEYNNCGREPNGHNVKEHGICPAAIEKKLNGVHGGVNAGRSCWVVAGTFCKGLKQGTFAQKYKSCSDCDFYQLVLVESFETFQVTTGLLKKLLDLEVKV